MKQNQISYLTFDRPLLLGGKWIIGPGAEVGRADFANIIAMDGGTLNQMYGGTLNQMHGGTLNQMHGGKLNQMDGGTLLEVFATYSPTICAGANITTDYRSK